MKASTVKFKAEFLKAINESENIEHLWEACDRFNADYLKTGRKDVKDLLEATEARLKQLHEATQC